MTKTIARDGQHRFAKLALLIDNILKFLQLNENIHIFLRLTLSL
jgi:hypothetical protein